MTAGPRASYDELAVLVQAQQRLIAAQAAQIEGLQAQVAELRRRLGLNSTNSSKPPSSDGLAKPPPRSLRRASGRRPGKQPGAPGTALSQVDDPDEVVEHRPVRCVGCRADLADAPVVGVVRRQVFDLPPVRMAVTEHQLAVCRCACARVTTAAAPAGVNAPAQYGPQVAALAAYLVVAQHVPVKRAVQILADLCGAGVSVGWVADQIPRAARGLTGFAQRVGQAVAAAPVVHFDETGARVAGRNRWVHVACTPLLTAYHVDDKRGGQAIDAMGVLPALRAGQTAVHDGWMPYLKDCYTDMAHALCNAHHLRELYGWAEHDPDRHGWAQALAGLLGEGKALVEAAAAAGHDRLDQQVLADLLARWAHGIDVAYAANPPPAGKGRGKILSLVDRLRGFTTEIWRFAHDFAVPFDNNQAERDLRMVKLQPKISGGWRTIDGARHWLRLRSYISTAAKHGIHTLTALRDAVTGNPWLPPLPT
ncbi:MAG TPA: IS66 family transposase [Jiangellaceae bacterium]|nr:IS66 family transposase [Jiangellaceae bacterium]